MREQVLTALDRVGSAHERQGILREALEKSADGEILLMAGCLARGEGRSRRGRGIRGLGMGGALELLAAIGWKVIELSES